MRYGGGTVEYGSLSIAYCDGWYGRIPQGGCGSVRIVELGKPDGYEIR